MSKKDFKSPSLIIAVIPVVMLATLLFYAVSIFGDGMLDGPSQIVLTLSTGVAAALAMGVCKHDWQDLENAMVHSIGRAMPACLILLMVGGLCGTWMHAGVIPTMIYYGLEVISPRWLLLTSCIVCALVSICIGSSWTTIATIGVGLIGVGRTLGIDERWVAGAIISGAYFGDKISPLSETTNLASSITEVPLFTHIRSMLRTTVPSILITLIIFAVAGITGSGVDTAYDATSTVEMQRHLQETFTINGWLLLLPLAVFFLIYRGLSATATLFLGMVVGMILVFTNQDFDFALRCAFGEVGYDTGFAPVDSLTNTRGMSGMLLTIWLIICSMSFGGIMERSGMLDRITMALLHVMKGRFTAVSTTCLSCICLNCVTADQYLSIVLPSRMYNGAFKRLKLPARLLSRTLEDGATVTSVLVPWNSCGMTQSMVLGVATLAYAPFAFFCWLSPLMTMLVSMLPGRKMKEDSLEKANIDTDAQSE